DIFKANIVDPGRMNTVFKFYFHAWALLGMASAYLLWRLRFGAVFLGRTRWGRVWMAGIGLLLLSGMIYPLAATPARSKIRFNSLSPTTDGMTYMKETVYPDDLDGNGLISTEERLELKWDYQAILWIQDNIRGSPVILEGNTPLYRWGNRVSVYTGLPTVVGWDWHQVQQRWDHQNQVFARRRDVQTLYSTSSIPTARQLLERYDVRYIYIGALERLYYPEEGLQKFSEMAALGSLEVVYPVAGEENPQVVIYRVEE
ncbi:MAG: hypothetical protein ACE5KI_06580, partial [Dehalococcoidia bacterium]